MSAEQELIVAAGGAPDPAALAEVHRRHRRYGLEAIGPPPPFS